MYYIKRIKRNYGEGWRFSNVNWTSKREMDYWKIKAMEDSLIK
jgi:hypothetical protein